MKQLIEITLKIKFGTFVVAFVFYAFEDISNKNKIKYGRKTT